jgi:hypothetical protein
VPTTLSDPPPVLYLVLIAFAVVTSAILARRQDKRSLISFAVALGLLLVVGLIDLLVESPREGAVTGIKAIVRGANDRDPEAFVAAVANSFEYKGAGPPTTVTRERLKSADFWGFLKANPRITVNAKDFAREDVTEIDPNTVEIGFVGQGRDDSTGSVFPMYFRATFTRQPDGKMRMTKLASFDYAKRTGERATIPNFP